MDNKRRWQAYMRRLLMAIVVSSLGLYMMSFIWGQNALRRFSNQLYQYKLPPHTQIVATQEIHGHLTGDKEKIDYVAIMLIKTKQSKEQIKSYYFNINFKGIKKRPLKPTIKIMEVEEKTGGAIEIGNQKIFFENLEQQDQQGKYMVIILLDRGYTSLGNGVRIGTS